MDQAVSAWKDSKKGQALTELGFGAHAVADADAAAHNFKEWDPAKMDEKVIHYLTDFVRTYDMAGQERAAKSVRAYVERLHKQTGTAREQQKKE